VDETYVGGKPRKVNEAPDAMGTRAFRPRGRTRKLPTVVALVERGGQIRPIHYKRVSAGTLKDVVRRHVHPSARLMTDEFRAYRGLGKEFEGGHETVRHTAGEYARGDATTNTVEGFFSILKRGLNGTFHSVSERHLHRYLSEFQFRYNTRSLDDGERVIDAIKKAAGKRLTYAEQVADNA
jgi:transposase-like protein